MKAALVVLGATGIVGRGVVQAAVEARRPVIAVARDDAGLAQLQLLHPGAHVTALPGSVANDSDGAVLAAALRGTRLPIAGVVAAVAGHGGRGRILDQPVEAMRCRLDADLLPHVAAARALLPLLAGAGRGGSYVLVGGPGSELPWAGYGHRSVAAAALRMLACVLHDEARAMGIRVQLLSVDAPVRIEAQRADAGPRWPTATAIGRCALALVERASASGPADAVVPYAHVLPDMGRRPALSPGRDRTSPPAMAPGGGDAAPIDECCLRDARALLRRTISSFNANEAFRHDNP